MAETAANLVDHVFPRVGVRQWVISFPFPIRYLLARDSKIQSACLEITLRAISTFLKKKVKKQGAKGRLQTGAVTLIQRAGGSVNLNPHLHREAGTFPRFHTLKSLCDEEIKLMVKTIALRVVGYLKRHGHFRDDSPYLASDDGTGDEILPALQAASVQSKIAIGKRKGHPIRRLGSLGQIIDERPETKAPLCASIQGFSLHAGVYCAPWERKELEKLCRYVARPAIAEERLRIFDSGEIGYKLKREYSDGTRALIFTPLEFMEKLAAIVPRPRVHLTRYAGCLGPHAKIRSLIIPKGPKKPEPPSATPAPVDDNAKPKSRRIGWAELLARVFAIDIRCPNCHTELKPLAAILQTKAITRILDHLGLPSKPPDIAPARLSVAIEYCQA